MLIYEFPINKRLVKVPQGAKLLDIKVQNDVIVAWMLCNPNNKDVYRFALLETEDSTSALHGDTVYKKTFQMYDRTSHVFEFTTPLSPEDYNQVDFLSGLKSGHPDTCRPVADIMEQKNLPELTKFTEVPALKNNRRVLPSGDVVYKLDGMYSVYGNIDGSEVFKYTVSFSDICALHHFFLNPQD